ncbi:MAG TPA: hypothetical protein VG652_11750 [Gaiellaceae bacterium]|nr:hypothetical protein [Gaiellaceae bacterium]
MGFRRRIGELVVVAALVCAAAGCGGGGSSSTTTTTGPSTSTTTTTTTTAGSATSPEAAIKAAWIKFFNGATPVAQRVALLAGGSHFSSTIKSLSSNPLASKTSATVSNVTVTSPTTATVTFSVSLAGLPVLKNVKGTAVKQNGSWLVDAGSLCKLLALQGSKPAACAGTSTSP